MNFYLDEKQRRKRQRLLKLKIYGGFFLFFILVVGDVYLIAYSPLFRIKNIIIQYLEVQPPDTSRHFLGIEPLLIKELKNFFSGQSKIAKFLGPDNILIWNSERSGEILKNYPQIAELKIEKDYFKREIKIIAKEREKFGIWCINQFQEVEPFEIDAQVDGQYLRSQASSILISCYWFDKNGVIFAEAPQAEGNLINKVNDFSVRSLKPGETVLKEKFFSNLLKIFEVLEKSELKIKSLKLERPELQEVVADSQRGFLPKVYFSLRIDPNFSLPALKSLENIGFEKIEYIDLRVENRVYYKLR